MKNNNQLTNQVTAKLINQLTSTTKQTKNTKQVTGNMILQLSRI